MDCSRPASWLKSSLRQQFVLFVIWLSSFQDLLVLQPVEPRQISLSSELAGPPGGGLFDPKDISPAIIPQYPPSSGTGSPFYPGPPVYPSGPTIYEPKLSGRCPVNFSSMSSILDKTASDCSLSFAAIVGNVICCPQFGSLIHIFRSRLGVVSSHKLVFSDAIALDCFSDIISVLASRGANPEIPKLCSISPANLTGGSCPVNDVVAFEKLVNTTELLDSCHSVDPLKECCRPTCQTALMGAALKISGAQTSVSSNKSGVEAPNHIDAMTSCKSVVYSYLSRKLSTDDANTAFRILSSCKVNKACPLEFKPPSEVIKACRNLGAPSPSCCSSLSSYITGIQNQMLITNKQAIICATVLGSMLRKGGVLTNVYELCDVDLKDFSMQAYGGVDQVGCLLRSLPSDLIYDNATGYSFTCDLTDNIGAPWPSSSSMSSMSLCAPEMSLPALPTSQTINNHGCHGRGVEFVAHIYSLLVLGIVLLY